MAFLLTLVFGILAIVGYALSWHIVLVIVLAVLAAVCLIVGLLGLRRGSGLLEGFSDLLEDGLDIFDID